MAGILNSKERMIDFISSDTAPAVTAMTRGLELTMKQHAVLVSVAYNIGAGTLKGSEAMKRLQAGDWEGFKFELGDKVKGFVKTTTNGKREFSQGLWNRRQEEIQEFFEDGNPPQPSPKVM